MLLQVAPNYLNPWTHVGGGTGGTPKLTQVLLVQLVTHALLQLVQLELSFAFATGESENTDNTSQAAVTTTATPHLVKNPRRDIPSLGRSSCFIIFPPSTEFFHMLHCFRQRNIVIAIHCLCRLCR